MTRYCLALKSMEDRRRAKQFIDSAPYGTRVELKAQRRSLAQNATMWQVLTDIAEQLPWHGVRLRPDDYKYILLDALKREIRIVPNIDGTGFVNLGRSSSDLTKQEMSDLIELAISFGAKHGVKFTIDRETPPPAEQG